MIRFAVVSPDDIITGMGECDEETFVLVLSVYPGISFDVTAYPEVTYGWKYNRLTGLFAPHWPQEQIDALAFLSENGVTARSKFTVSGVEHDGTEDAFARLTARIRAREERGDLGSDVELWRLRNGSYVSQSFDADKELLVAMYEHVQACEDVQSSARTAVLAAIAAESLTALATAKNPTWPS